MQLVDLSGSWSVRRVGESHRSPATVPGCVHADLLAAGKIEDPYWRDNENDQRWIGESDWIYSRSFDAPADVLRRD